MKKVLKIFIVCVLMTTSISSINAEAPDFSDSGYWDEYCSLEHDTSNAYKACNKYYDYQLENFEKMIQESKDEIEELANKIAILNKQIEDLNKQIELLNIEITNLEIIIEETIFKIEDIELKIKERMIITQETMHFNSYLNFILGASSFEELIKRKYLVDQMADKEITDRTNLKNYKQQLDENKLELDNKKYSLDESKKETQNAKDNCQYLLGELDRKLEQLEQMQSVTLHKIDINLEEISRLDGYAPSDSFIHPVSNSWISAGPWYYDDAHTQRHLGVDYAAGLNTPLLAPATGYVALRSDSCGYGYLGSRCGNSNGVGLSGAGNSIYLVVEIDNSIYGLIFMHLVLNTAHEIGFVKQGEQVGLVGSSGSSTGPHAHIELYYLGEGKLTNYLNENYISNTFGVSRLSQDVYSTQCVNSGFNAPCRLDARDYFR